MDTIWTPQRNTFRRTTTRKQKGNMLLEMWLRLGQTKKNSNPTWTQDEKDLNSYSNSEWRQKETRQDTTWRQRETIRKDVSTSWRRRKK